MDTEAIELREVERGMAAERLGLAGRGSSEREGWVESGGLVCCVGNVKILCPGSCDSHPVIFVGAMCDVERRKDRIRSFDGETKVANEK